jgi:hypothetical protein
MMRAFSFALSARQLLLHVQQKKSYKGHYGHRLVTNHHHHYCHDDDNHPQQYRHQHHHAAKAHPRAGGEVARSVGKSRGGRALQEAEARGARCERALSDLVAMWFMQGEEADVKRHAAMAEECLDDTHVYAKRKGRALSLLEYLLRGILESEALEPYLKRWKRDDAAAAAAAAAAPLRARAARTA